MRFVRIIPTNASFIILLSFHGLYDTLVSHKLIDMCIKIHINNVFQSFHINSIFLLVNLT
jgi:hypothetical protein